MISELSANVTETGKLSRIRLEAEPLAVKLTPQSRAASTSMIPQPILLSGESGLLAVDLKFSIISRGGKVGLAEMS